MIFSQVFIIPHTVEIEVFMKNVGKFGFIYLFHSRVGHGLYDLGAFIFQVLVLPPSIEQLADTSLLISSRRVDIYLIKNFR